MREVTQGFVTCDRPGDAKPMGNLETASQALLLAALKGKLLCDLSVYSVTFFVLAQPRTVDAVINLRLV